MFYLEAEGYKKTVLLFLVVIPLHELIHSGTCMALGGQVTTLEIFSYAVCEGTVSSQSLFAGINSVNQLFTAGIVSFQIGRLHFLHLLKPVLDAL